MATTLICLLRGINVSGHRSIPIPGLKALFSELGFAEVVTYIQSGNVIFRASDLMSQREVAEKISHGILRKFGFDVPAIIRDSDEWKSILDSNPFLEDPSIDISRLHVTLLDREADAGQKDGQIVHEFQPDLYFINKREIYLFCPDGYGRTRINNQFFEKKFRASATTRNWKTMQALAGLVNISTDNAR